jgi:hypothetical protein
MGERVFKSCACRREKGGAWGFNQRTIVENRWDVIERGRSVGDAVLLMSGLWN